MISAVKGKIFDIGPGMAHVETGAGLVFKILYPVSHYGQLKRDEQVLLYTVQKVKEDDMILYGFASKKERTFFERLISVSGVGGKTALSLISAFSTAELIAAVDGGDVAKLSSIPGVGKKTAGRIILDLTGKLELEEEEARETVKLKEDLVSGLVNLGYPARSVRDQVNRVLKEHPDSDSFEELFKMVLKRVAKQ